MIIFGSQKPNLVSRKHMALGKLENYADQEISVGHSQVFFPEQLEEALAQAELEGLRPSPEALLALKAVAEGALSGEAYLDQMKLRYGRLKTGV